MGRTGPIHPEGRIAYSGAVLTKPKFPMLKNRQDGLVSLHGTALFLLVGATFVLSLLVVTHLGWIQFHSQVNWPLYLVGVCAAMAWVVRSLKAVGDRLGALTWLESGRLAAQQLVRLMVVLFTLVFVMKDVGMSRAFLMGFLVLTLFLLALANRWLAPAIARLFFRHHQSRTIIVASAPDAQLLLFWLKPRIHLGIDPIGFVDPVPHPDRGAPGSLGSLVELEHLILQQSADQLVVDRGLPAATLALIAAIAERARVRVHFFADLQAVFGNASAPIDRIGHYTFSGFLQEPLENPFNRALKRSLDLAVALPCVVFILPPLTLLVWLAQRSQAPGPVLYRQSRSGLNRQRFEIYKFRTMFTHNVAAEDQQASRTDARIYPFGRFLRRSSLDEFPQFLNVLLGDMSVSGPRPHMLEHDASFARLETSYFRRHFVKPGITGLAQSRGFRGELVQASDLSNRIHCDETYVSTWSFKLDLMILLLTIGQLVNPPRSAY